MLKQVLVSRRDGHSAAFSFEFAAATLVPPIVVACKFAAFLDSPSLTAVVSSQPALAQVASFTLEFFLHGALGSLSCLGRCWRVVMIEWLLWRCLVLFTVASRW